MKNTIQNNLRNFLVMSSLLLLGLTSYGQSTYEPGKTYTFRTLISPTHTIQIEVVYDAKENATVTLTKVSPQPEDKAYSHIFLPENDEYSFDKNTGGLIVSKNHSYYKVINLIEGTSSEITAEKQLVPICNGCKLGEAGSNCKPATIETSKGKWSVWCDWDGNEKTCQICNDLDWEIKDVKYPSIVIIRVNGKITIQ